jgi:uncharacterized protein YcfJ
VNKKTLLVPLLALAFVSMGAAAQDSGYPPPPPPPDAGGPPPGPGGPGPQQPQGGPDNAHTAWADVLRVDPVYGVARTAQPQCYDQQVVQQTPSNKGIGTVLGAVVGGVLGSTIGHGRGNTAATVGGAVVGGAVGNSVASGGSTTVTNQTVCQQGQVVDQRQIIGYDVEYRYHGDIYMSRLSYDPGERLRVRVSVSPAD